MKKPMLKINVKTILGGKVVDTAVKHHGDYEIVLAYLADATNLLINDMVKASNGKLSREKLYKRLGEMLIRMYENK